MNDYIGVFVAISLLAAGTSVVVAVQALRRRHVPGATAFGAMMLAAAWWCIAYSGEILSTSLDAKEWWARVGYIGIVAISPSWLIFGLEYSGRVYGRVRLSLVLLWAIPALTVAAVFLSPSVGLVWSSTHLASLDSVTMLGVEHGPWFWLHTAYSYGCLLAGSVVLLGSVLSEVKTLTLQGVTMVVAVALPWLANAITLVFLGPWTTLDITPPVIVLSGALISLGLSRFGLLHVFPAMVPVARDTVMRGMRDGVLVVGRNGLILNANRAAEHLLGAEPGELAGRGVADLIPALSTAGGDDPESRTPISEYSIETTLQRPGSEDRVVEILVSPFGANPAAPGVAMAMRDVTERRYLEEELKHRALHDDLTGLPNRALLREQLKTLNALQRRDDRHIALLMLDLDRFKQINDTLGHGAGDQVLCTTASRLREALRESDLVARLGGDEYAVVVSGCTPAEAVALATTLRDRVTAPQTIKDRELTVSVSVGIAVGPEHGTDDGALLQHADVALYLAKGSPRGVALYEPDLDPNSPERLALISSLRDAVRRRDLSMAYQPVVSAADGVVVRVEALARWPLQNGRVLGAAEFMPLAQESDLLTEITEWALDEALGQSRRWEAAGWCTEIAVNLSPADLADPELFARVSAALSRAQVDPERLWLEVSESSVMANPQRARMVLSALRTSGVRVSIDDFGAGRSSLVYLRTLPAAELKIDRAFVRGLSENAADLAVVSAAVTLGHDLGLLVTGEGVEAEGSLPQLAALGCDCVQGYCIAAPMPADDLLRWMRTRVSGASSAAGSLMVPSR